jgi:hypothetical protein
MIDSTAHALDADVEWRQQDDVVQVSQAGCACERRQKPWGNHTLKDDEADVAEPPGSGPAASMITAFWGCACGNHGGMNPCLIMGKKASPGTSALGFHRLASSSDTEDLPAPGWACHFNQFTHRSIVPNAAPGMSICA